MTSALMLVYKPPFSGPTQVTEKTGHAEADPDDIIVPKPSIASACCAWERLAKKMNPQITASKAVFLKRNLQSVRYRIARMPPLNLWDARCHHHSFWRSNTQMSARRPAPVKCRFERHRLLVSAGEPRGGQIVACFQGNSGPVSADGYFFDQVPPPRRMW